MKNSRVSWNDQSRFYKFCSVSIPLAILAGISLLYFGARLNPENAMTPDGQFQHRAVEALSYSNAVVKRCIEAQNANKPQECDDLKQVFEIFQSVLDLGAQERLAGSAMQLSKLGYWQYLAIGLAMLFLLLGVGASYVLLYEAIQITGFIRDSVQTSAKSREAELQPYLNITDVSIQTGEPPFGGGYGWIDITFKNFGKTPARYFRNHVIDNPPAPGVSQYVEMLDDTPVVHVIKSPGEGAQQSDLTNSFLLDLINTGEERTVRCPIVTDILDRSVKQRYMETEWERRRDGITLPRFEGYRVQGSVEFSNCFHHTTTRRLRYELNDSVDNGRSFRIIEDTNLS